MSSPPSQNNALPARPNKRKDPVGTNVFYPALHPVGSPNYYPSPLPPPPRRSLRGSSSSASNTSASINTTSHDATNHSPLSATVNLPGLTPSAHAIRLAKRTPPRAPGSLPAPHPSVPPLDPTSVAKLAAASASSEYAEMTYDPYESISEYPFPSPPTTFPGGSPFVDLPHLSTLNISTPASGRLADITPFESPAEPDVLSPPEAALPPSAVFTDGTFTISPPQASGVVDKGKGKQREVDVFESSPTRPTLGRSAGSTPFFLGSPTDIPRHNLSPGHAQRQSPWANAFIRRGSAPQVHGSPLWLPYRAPTPLSALQSSPSARPEFIREQSIPEIPTGDSLFSSDYSFPPSSVLPPTPPNALNLQLTGSPPVTCNSSEKTERDPEPGSPDDKSSQVAHQYLADKVLPADFELRYTVGNELGSGGFGFVCVATQTGFDNIAGVEVAVKFIFKSKLATDNDSTINGEPVESYVLRRLDHPSIIKWIGLYEDSEFFYLVQELHGEPWEPGHTLESSLSHHPNANITVPGLAMPFSPPTPLSTSPLSANSLSASPTAALATPIRTGQGQTGYFTPSARRPSMQRRSSYDLFEAVEHQRFSEDQAKYIFGQIVDAVAYLHSQGVYHRDLKDENIVIDRNLKVKIIDFGSAVVEDKLLPPILYSNFRGTTTYAAAEILKGRHHHAAPADIWSLGVILSIILTGTAPFEDNAMAREGKIRFRKGMPSREAMSLLKSCFQVDPRKRATIEQVKAHGWFRREGGFGRRSFWRG